MEISTAQAATTGLAQYAFAFLLFCMAFAGVLIGMLLDGESEDGD